MNLAKRLEAVEAAVAKELGETNYKMVWKENDQTEEEAKVKAGLSDFNGTIIFFSWDDANL